MRIDSLSERNKFFERCLRRQAPASDAALDADQRRTSATKSYSHDKFFGIEDADPAGVEGCRADVGAPRNRWRRHWSQRPPEHVRHQCQPQPRAFPGNPSALSVLDTRNARQTTVNSSLLLILTPRLDNPVEFKIS